MFKRVAKVGLPIIGRDADAEFDAVQFYRLRARRVSGLFVVVTLVNNAFALSGKWARAREWRGSWFSEQGCALAERPSDGRFIPLKGSRSPAIIMTFSKIASAMAISAQLARRQRS
jgi:hypothetical protein